MEPVGAGQEPAGPSLVSVSFVSRKCALCQEHHDIEQKNQSKASQRSIAPRRDSDGDGVALAGAGGTNDGCTDDAR